MDKLSHCFMLLTDNWSRAGCSFRSRCKAILPDGSQSEAGKMPSGKRGALLCRCTVQIWQKLKKKGKNIYGEWDGSLNGLLLIPVFPKSELCIPAWSLEGKPRVGVYFRLQGCIFFFFNFFWVTVYFAAQHLDRFCSHLNVLYFQELLQMLR